MNANPPVDVENFHGALSSIEVHRLSSVDPMEQPSISSGADVFIRVKHFVISS